MDTRLGFRLRTGWPVLVTLAVFVFFAAVHALVYAPLAGRYRSALEQAGQLGALLDPSRGAMPAALPPRVYALLMANSGPAAVVDARTQAGALGADLVQQLSSLATGRHLDVVVAEPGPITQQTGWNDARAHLRMRGSWAGWLAFLDAIGQDGRLVTIERFSLSPTSSGSCDIEVWCSGTTLKRRRPES